MKLPRVFQTAGATLTIILLFGAGAFTQQRKHEDPQQRKSEVHQESQAIKMATDLVSLSVTVTDRRGQPVTGLEKEEFTVYENGVKQEINFFSTEEPPVSWGLVLDRSGSMRGMIESVYRAAVHVVDEGTDEDEAFIVTFNKKVELVSGFDSDKRHLQNSIAGLRADGGTALWDATDFALNELKRGRHPKKVLVVITDGEDNSSRIGFRELTKRVEEANALIYTVGMFESGGGFRLDAPSVERPGWNAGWVDSHGGIGEWMGGSYPRKDLEKLAEVTGAQAHFPTNVEECREAMREIAGEVSHQYSLGYYPNNATNDGKWRKLRVVVNRSGGKTEYVTRTRAGYYAPKDKGMK